MLPSVHWVAYTKNKKQETHSLKSLQRALVFPFFLTDERARELGTSFFSLFSEHLFCPDRMMSCRMLIAVS